ncbi:hypothetical protein M9H77_31747 [Catharanthus roseus]|uniref:Uncharacterized protein n=1 Tax=Catharanthus roseus TaxID=4058 RepID=A0ACC0A2T3_CATRO|nr:hypothetical protein M9H77_31747 [Catharanthus roseus]
MDPFEDFEQENVGFEHFAQMGEKTSKHSPSLAKDGLVDWAKQIAMKANAYLIVNRYQKSRTSDHRPESKLLQIRIGNYSYTKGGTTINKLSTIKVMLRLQDLRRSSCNRLSSSGRVMCRFETSYDFSVNKTAQKIYNVVAKIRKNRMQGQHTVEEVLCLSAKQGYTVFYRNCEESNVLRDIVVEYTISIAMIRMWPYLKILTMISHYLKIVYVQYTTIGSCRDVPTRKNFIVAIAFMCNEQATTYR